MAEGLFQLAFPGKAVFSAGLCAMEGDPADPIAVQLMREVGVDISRHRARNLAAWMVSEADLIVTMDWDQKRFIESRYAGMMKGKIMRLGEAGRYDIPDPYQQGPTMFLHTYKLISEGIDALAARIARNEQQTVFGLLPARETPLPLKPLAPQGTI